MKYLLNYRNFIFLMVLFSFFDNFGMEKGETDEDYDHLLNKDNDYNYLFKVVFVGDAGVGKTQIINKFVKNKFSNDYNPTIGLDFYSKTINSNGKIIKLQLWDTAGQEKFRTITRTYYKSGHLIVFVYAVDDKKSFGNIQSWVDDVKNNTNEKTKFLLVGNKCDLGKDKRQVSTEEAQQYAKEKNMEFIEVSAKEGTNINDMFNSSLSKILDDMEKEKNNNPTYNNPKYIEHKIPDYHIQDINGIKNKKDSCWSEYCSCCPCLEKTEKNNKNQDNDEEQEEIENEEQEEKEGEEQEEI